MKSRFQNLHVKHPTIRKEDEKEMEIETNSQLVKQILELCEAYNMPPEIVALIKNKCWKLTRNKENENDKKYSMQTL